MQPPLRQHDHHAFLVLPENRLAVAAVKKLKPKIRNRLVSLVTLIGPPGVGKSRLTRDLIRSWSTAKSDGKLVSITASEFAAQFAEASSEGSIPQFQAQYRKSVRLFICEDLQAIAKRHETQTQLLAVIDEVIANDGCVLLSSTVMPGEIKGLSRRLVNRVHGGLCVSMELPDLLSRQKLIKHFLTSDSLQLSEVDIELIAQSYPVSARELLGLLTQLSTQAGKNSAKSTITLEDILNELTVRQQISLHDISRETAKAYGVTIADMKSPRRTQTISTARQTAMFLAREMSSQNYKQIGAYFNRRNHSTVIHACQKIETSIQTEPRVAHDVAIIRKSLQSGSR